jgi:quinol monooxygenase YgiN
MLTIVAKLQAAPGKEARLQEVLTEMVANVKAHEAGKTTVYSLHTSPKEPGLFLFYEQYANQEAADAHGKTGHMRTMGRTLRDEGLIAGPPVIDQYVQVAGVS